MSIAFGIIGCRHGHITVFIDEMIQLGHTFAGIYDQSDKKMAEQIASKYGVPLLNSLDALLDPAVQIIGSSAINSEKINIIEWCEKHGKHIMVDKPAITDRDKLHRLEGVIERGSIQIGMLLTERFRPAIHTLKQAIESGELGRIVSLSMRKPHRLRPASRSEWHFSKAQNGGVIIDLFVHDFDLLRWLTDQEAVSVQAVVTKNIMPEYPDFWDAASAQVVLDGGAIGQLYSDWHSPEKSWTWGDCRIFVSGTAGSAELRLCGDPSVSQQEELYLQVTNSLEFTSVELNFPTHTITEDFLLRIAGEDYQARITQKDILAASALTIAADESAVVVNNLG
jgi:predicted dehydrogenase